MPTFDRKNDLRIIEAKIWKSLDDSNISFQHFFCRLEPKNSNELRPELSYYHMIVMLNKFASCSECENTYQFGRLLIFSLYMYSMRWSNIAVSIWSVLINYLTIWIFISFFFLSISRSLYLYVSPCIKEPTEKKPRYKFWLVCLFAYEMYGKNCSVCCKSRENTENRWRWKYLAAGHILKNEHHT